MDDMLTNDPYARPGGVTALALLAYISGLFTIGVAVFGLIGFTSPQTKASYANPSLAVAALIIHGLVGVGYMVVASGMWRLRPWAFWAAIIASVLLLANYAFEFWQRVLTSPVTVGGIALPILILLYFGLSRTARHAFGVGETSAASSGGPRPPKRASSGPF